MPTEQAEYQEGARARKARTPLILIGAAAVVLAAALPRLSPGWTSVGPAQARAISGLAVLGTTPVGVELLIVHDNKRAGEARLASMTLGRDPHYTPLAWPAGSALPVDLEAITALPGAPGQFLVATSAGKVNVIGVQDGHVTALGAFTLPHLPPAATIEVLTVARINGVLVIAWGHRGAGLSRGRLYWGTFDPGARTIADVQSATVSVPYPNPIDPRTRHISDLRIDPRGHLWSTATHDPGDNGPFASALYDLGVFRVSGSKVNFAMTTPLVPLETFSNKVEALELLNGGTTLVLGTDDEAAGGTVKVERIRQF